MANAEFSSTVAGRLFTDSVAIRRDALFSSPNTQTETALAEIRRPGAATVHTYAALEAIASSGLNAEQKDALIKLTAQVDERERGNPSFLKDMETLVALLDAGADPAQRESMTLDAAIGRYEDARRYLGQNPAVEVAFSLSFRQFSSQVVVAQNKAEQDFLRVATQADMMHAFALAQQVLGRGVDLFA